MKGAAHKVEGDAKKAGNDVLQVGGDAAQVAGDASQVASVVSPVMKGAHKMGHHHHRSVEGSEIQQRDEHNLETRSKASEGWHKFTHFMKNAVQKVEGVATKIIREVDSPVE